MARKREAVADGSTTKRTRRARPADAADPNDAGKSGSAMSSTNSKAKRNPRRGAKDRWEEEKLMTSTNSQLIDIDLVKLLANPEAWNCLEEAEKEEILGLLPENIHPNRDGLEDNPDAKIPPLSESFLRYSNQWRDGIRQFQLDLQNGRYDPQWLQQADEAMRERHAGKFDKFKEEEFEEFWGQKQKMDKTIAAGESSQVKLSTLIENGVVREGDVWKYSRAFSKGFKKPLLIEKEARIVEINGSRLTFAIPPGQRVFLPTIQTPAKQVSAPAQKAKDNTATAEPKVNGSAEGDAGVHENTDRTLEAGSLKRRISGAGSRTIRSSKRKQTSMSQKGDNPSIDDDQVLLVSELPKKARSFTVEIINPRPVVKEVLPAVVTDTPTTTVVEPEEDAKPLPEAPNANPPASELEEIKEIIIPNLAGPHPLGMKILEVDGRVHDIPNGNAWKEFRSYRNNQDMGSLWEVRQAWYLRKK